MARPWCSTTQTLERLTEGSGRLDAMTAAELKRVPFRATADRMITLGELCDLVAGRAALLIEIKSRFDGDLRLVTRAAASARGLLRPRRADVVRSCADRGAAHARPAPAARHRRRAALYPSRMEPAAGAHQARARLFPARARAAARSSSPIRSRTCRPRYRRLARNAACGLPLLTWTVRTDVDRERAARYADQMIFEGFRP